MRGSAPASISAICAAKDASTNARLRCPGPEWLTGRAITSRDPAPSTSAMALSAATFERL